MTNREKALEWWKEYTYLEQRGFIEDDPHIRAGKEPCDMTPSSIEVIWKEQTGRDGKDKTDLQYVQDISRIVTLLQQHEQQYVWGLWEGKVTLVLNFSENEKLINEIYGELDEMVNRTGIDLVRDDEFEINESTGELRLVDKKYKPIEL